MGVLPDGAAARDKGAAAGLVVILVLATHVKLAEFSSYKHAATCDLPPMCSGQRR